MKIWIHRRRRYAFSIRRRHRRSARHRQWPAYQGASAAPSTVCSTATGDAADAHARRKTSERLLAGISVLIHRPKAAGLRRPLHCIEIAYSQAGLRCLSEASKFPRCWALSRDRGADRARRDSSGAPTGGKAAAPSNRPITADQSRCAPC